MTVKMYGSCNDYIGLLHSLANRKGPSWVQPMFLAYGSEDGPLVPGGATGDLKSRPHRDPLWSDGQWD